MAQFLAPLFFRFALCICRAISRSRTSGSLATLLRSSTSLVVQAPSRVCTCRLCACAVHTCEPSRRTLEPRRPPDLFPSRLEPGWMAPEVEAGQPYDVSSDIYGLGMVLCRILEFASVIYDIVYGLVIEKCLDRPPTPPRHCIVSHSNSLPLTVRC